MRSFYRADIERYLDISFNETRPRHHKTDPMFRRLRTTRFLSPRATFEGQAWDSRRNRARIARRSKVTGLQDQGKRQRAMAKLSNNAVNCWAQ